MRQRVRVGAVPPPPFSCTPHRNPPADIRNAQVGFCAPSGNMKSNDVCVWARIPARPFCVSPHPFWADCALAAYRSYKEYAQTDTNMSWLGPGQGGFRNLRGASNLPSDAIPKCVIPKCGKVLNCEKILWRNSKLPCILVPPRPKREAPLICSTENLAVLAVEGYFRFSCLKGIFGLGEYLYVRRITYMLEGYFRFSCLGEIELCPEMLFPRDALRSNVAPQAD